MGAQESKTETAKILDKIKTNKIASVFGSKTTVRGAFIGLAGGWLLASYFKLPKILGMVAGIAIGTTTADVIDGYLNNMCTVITKKEDGTTKN